MTEPGHCPHCNVGIFKGNGEKTKLRTSILVVHKASGAVETNCPRCKKAIMLPMVAQLDRPLQKSDTARFGVPLDRTKKSHA